MTLIFVNRNRALSLPSPLKNPWSSELFFAARAAVLAGLNTGWPTLHGLIL